jgi:hypothetical protein
MNVLNDEEFEKKVADEISQNGDLYDSILSRLWKLILTLVDGWATEDIKELSTFLNSFNLNGKYKTFKELKLMCIIISILHTGISGVDINDVLEMKKNLEETLELQKKKNAELEKYENILQEKHFTIHMKDMFPKIHKIILELRENGQAHFEPGHINLRITQRQFARIAVDSGYNSQFLLFLPKFRINGNEINKDSFQTECANARKS